MSDPPPIEESLTCPFCGSVSYNPNDIEQGYCANCHVFLRDVLFAFHCSELANRMNQLSALRRRQRRLRELLPILRWLCFAVVLNFVVVIVEILEGHWEALPGNVIAALISLGVIVWSVRKAYR